MNDLVMGVFFVICGLGVWLGGVCHLVVVCLLGMMVCLEACGLEYSLWQFSWCYVVF